MPATASALPGDAIALDVFGAAPVTTQTAVEACNVCPHPLDKHDPIARRFCAATFANAITRGCMCG